MANKPVILLVDDAPENIDVLKGILQEQYVLRAAIGGELALRLALIEPLPELILLDIMMPEMDGYEVCRRLKADPVSRDIPLIFVTACAGNEDEVEGLYLGAVDYLTKPLVPAIVRARVETHLSLSRMRRELEQKNLLLNDEKQLLEEIVTRMRADNPFDQRHVRLVQKSLQQSSGDIALSAYRPDGAQHVLVGDFSGHGLPAAFAGPLVSYVFYSRTAAGNHLAQILAEVNGLLYRQLPTHLYMAVSALELSPDRGRALLWNFGLPPVLCLSDETGMMKVESVDMPLGICEWFDGIEPHAFLSTTPGMRIYQYSDGITEAMSLGHEMFWQSRLDELVARIYRENLPLEVLWDALDAHCSGLGLSDDALLVETSVGVAT